MNDSINNLIKNNFKLLIAVLALTFVIGGCEKEEDFNSGNNSDDNNTSSGWADNYWKKNGEEVYIDLTATIPKFCSNGNPVPGTYSSLRWESSSIAFFTLYNAGDEVDFRIKKSGNSLILAPWDARAQQTHNPSTYTLSSTFPCNGGGSATSGKIAFYTRKDNGCSSISITVDGSITQNLQYYHSDGIGDCTQGEVFSLPAGNHSFTAACNSKTWSGNFRITSGGCILFDLR
jgi:hypothetical protein